MHQLHDLLILVDQGLVRPGSFRAISLVKRVRKNLDTRVAAGRLRLRNDHVDRVRRGLVLKRLLLSLFFGHFFICEGEPFVIYGHELRLRSKLSRMLLSACLLASSSVLGGLGSRCQHGYSL